MQQAIAGARLHRIAGTGHAPDLEAPAELNALLESFLSALR